MKKLPLFAVAIVAAIPALWFIWIVVGGPILEDSYGTFQVEVFKNKAVLVLLILTLIVCALVAFMPFLALIFGGGSDSRDGSVALAGGGAAAGVHPRTDDDPFVADADAFDDDDPFTDEEAADDDDSPFADEEESDDELEIEGLDEVDIFDEEGAEEDDLFAFDDE